MAVPMPTFSSVVNSSTPSPLVLSASTSVPDGPEVTERSVRAALRPPHTLNQRLGVYRGGPPGVCIDEGSVSRATQCLKSSVLSVGRRLMRPSFASMSYGSHHSSLPVSSPGHVWSKRRAARLQKLPWRPRDPNDAPGTGDLREG